MPWPSSASCRSISALFANATLVGRANRFAARGGEDVCVSALIGRQRQTLMLEQLFRPLRHTMPFEVTGCRTHGDASARQSPHHDTGTAHALRDHDPDVEAFFDHIDLAVDQGHIGHDPRIALCVSMQRRREVIQAEHDRGDDPQRADGRGCGQRGCAPARRDRRESALPAPVPGRTRSATASEWCGSEAARQGFVQARRYAGSRRNSPSPALWRPCRNCQAPRP